MRDLLLDGHRSFSDLYSPPVERECRFQVVSPVYSQEISSSSKPQDYALLMVRFPAPYSGPNSTTHAVIVPLHSVVAQGPCGNTLSEIRLTNEKGPQECQAPRP